MTSHHLSRNDPQEPPQDAEPSPRPFFPSIMVPVLPFAVGAGPGYFPQHQGLVPLSPAAAAADPSGFYHGIEEGFDTCGPGYHFIPSCLYFNRCIDRPPISTSSTPRGPKGSNLFVFHLPAEMTNWDFYLLFRKFGVLLSVRREKASEISV